MHAGDEEDADVINIKRAMEYAHDGKTVIVSANDTDVLVILIYHATCEMDIRLQRSAQNTISIRIVQEALGPERCYCLPFAHATSGCNTTPSMYGLGN